MIYVFLFNGNETFNDFMATITGNKENAVVLPFVIAVDIPTIEH